MIVMRIKLDMNTIRYINLFESITGVMVKDCIINEDRDKITFVVNEGQIGIAIGKNGMNVKKVQRALNKQVELLEFSKDPAKFISNIFRPIKLKEVNITDDNGKKVAYVSFDDNRAGMIRSKMRVVKHLIPKYFDIQEVVYR